MHSDVSLHAGASQGHFSVTTPKPSNLQPKRSRKQFFLQRSSLISQKEVSWRFIMQKAAWNGGIWERLVRSVKRCLRKVIGRAALNYEELVTLLIEIEGIINSRPITYVYDDTEGVSYPLTPAELSYGRSTTRTPNGKHFEIVSTNETLTKRANYHRKLLHNFTKRWKNEYLLGIREALSSTITSEQR